MYMFREGERESERERERFIYFYIYIKLAFDELDADHSGFISKVGM